jgi:hypothetical protein
MPSEPYHRLQTVYDWGNPSAVKRFLSFHNYLVSTGVVDGTFADKPNVYPVHINGSWFVCECDSGPCGGHSFRNSCG